MNHSPAIADSLRQSRRLLEQGRIAEAAPLLQQVLRADPTQVAALHQLGRIAAQLDMPHHAVRLMRRALRAGGQSPRLLNDLGAALVQWEDLPTASRCFRRCIDHYPGSVLGYVSLAYVKNRQGDFAAAESLYRRAIATASEPLEAELNLATLYREWGRLNEAIKLFDDLIARYPDIPLLADGRARALLQQRNWSDGWPAYEARLSLDDEPARINLDLPLPRWRGESLAGKHLLVLCEQGIGDEVQFASCYPDVITRAASCTITCSPRLQPIFLRSFPQVTWVPVDATDRESWIPPCASDFDLLTPAGSLPRYLRRDDHDFPGQPYLTASRPSSTCCRGPRDRLRVGVSWRGGALPEQIRMRSIPLETFRRLFQIDGVQFVNLQHGCLGEPEKAAVAACDNLQSDPAVNPLKELEPWFDRIASLDLLISVDNSNVHFAGALGIPTWLLLPDHPNWRWPLDGEIPPWYGSVELIRKSPDRDWTGTIERVAQRLAVLADQEEKAA